MRAAVRRSLLPVASLAAALSLSTVVAQEKLHPRTAYDVPLARLSVRVNEETNRAERVRVSFEGTDDYANIGPLNDERVERTRLGRETVVYREPWQVAHTITEFEGEQLFQVVKRLASTLEDFEGDLHKGRWGRIHYLDGFLPRFLRGFYFLYDAMVCHQKGLPRWTCVPESAFDVSLTSPKTDARIADWRSEPDHIIKLRIVTKELVFQLEQWMDKAKRDYQLPLSRDAMKAYTLFIRIYFRLNPPPRAPSEDEHL